MCILLGCVIASKASYVYVRFWPKAVQSSSAVPGSLVGSGMGDRGNGKTENEVQQHRSNSTGPGRHLDG